LRKTILPVFGARKLADITAADVQTFVTGSTRAAPTRRRSGTR
jgi:hypothetical protein